MAARRRVSSYDSTDDSQYFAPPENNLPAEDPGGGQDGGAPPYEDGGITGKTPNPPTPPPPAAQTAWGQYGSQLGGFDPAKTNKVDPKYVFAKYASNYDVNDPAQRDKLLQDLRNDPSGFFKNASMNGDILHGSYDPDTGRYGDVDFITGMHSDHPTWGWGAIDESVGKMPGGGGPVPLSPGGGGGGVPGPSGGGGGHQPYDIKAELAKLFPDGAFNKNALNARVSNLSDILNRNRKSQMATNSALLGDRGQGINDGTYGTSAGNLETRLNENFNSGVNDAFAHESDLADARMIQALSLATGLSEEEAKNAVDMARIGSDSALGWGNIALGNKNADINRELGQGNIGLGYYRAGNDYDLGLGNLGLGRDTLNANIHNASVDDLIRLYQIYFGGQANSNQGYVGK